MAQPSHTLNTTFFPPRQATPSIPAPPNPVSTRYGTSFLSNDPVASTSSSASGLDYQAQLEPSSLKSRPSGIPQRPTSLSQPQPSSEKTKEEGVEAQLGGFTIENITSNVQAINSTCSNRRLKYLVNQLVGHIHDYVRETRLNTEEWMTALKFLAETGQMCSDVRQEFVLLSDILGLSLLVDSIDHPVPRGATDPTVLGPFHTVEAQHFELGETLSEDKDGVACLCVCSVKNMQGEPLESVSVDVWETDSHGLYDVQRDSKHVDGRGILTSNEEGLFWYKAILPVPYPIPADGPVGKLLGRLGRHEYRPSHMHFKLTKLTGSGEQDVEYEDLVTALYLRDSPYLESDAVFGVKESLIVNVKEVDKETAEKYAVEEGMKMISYDFVMVEKSVTKELKLKQAKEAMGMQGRECVFIDGLPVPALD